MVGGVTSIVLLVAATAWRVKQVARRSAGTGAGDAAFSAPTSRVAKPLDVAEAVYDGAMGSDWQDWGWGPHEIPNVGPAKVEFAGYGGITLHHGELNGAFGGLALRYKPPGAWKDFLAIGLKRGGTAITLLPQVLVQPRHVAKLADGWLEVFIEWSELNPSNLPFDSLIIAAHSSVPSGWVLLDKIVLTKGKPGKAPTRNAELAIGCGAARGAISPLIYGASAGDADSGYAAQRLGGNPMSRLNWEAGLWNSGADWFFENSKLNGSVWAWLDDGVRANSPTALVVPMIGWVAKDATSVGFPKAKFPKQRKFDPSKPHAGDGFNADGSKIAPGPATETSIAAPPEMIGRWIRSLREKDRERGARSVQMYILDNEPSLWNLSHRDVHPEPTTYAELLDRTRRYATEIRNADAEAVIAGPAEWGWRGYFLSGLDQASDSNARPDQRAHGDEPLVPWYLRQLAKHERETGVRLLDVLDVHFYPAAEGMYGSDARVDREGADLRLRSTRALWDPTYRDESWIKEPIELIPRLKRWVAENYPGRKISIGEWSFGAEAHISGGLATAEALGRFGQQGLDAAFYWGGPKAGTPTFWAFRAYRNFDGAGGRFLDLSLPTREGEKLSLFASGDSAGTHIVAVLVNTDATFAVNARIDLGSCRKLVSRRVFSYGPGSTALAATPPEKDAKLGEKVSIAPLSFAVLDMQVQSQ